MLAQHGSGAGDVPALPQDGGTPAGVGGNPMTAEQMTFFMNQPSGGGRRNEGGDDDEFRRAWRHITLSVLKDGSEWQEWNFKFKTACAEAHPIIIQLIEEAEQCMDQPTAPYTDGQ